MAEPFVAARSEYVAGLRYSSKPLKFVMRRGQWIVQWSVKCTLEDYDAARAHCRMLNERIAARESLVYMGALLAVYGDVIKPDWRVT